MDINDKLATLKYNTDSESHLSVDNDVCMRCKLKSCLTVCPANVYEWSEEEGILIIRYENCLECGACRIICPKKAISWQYPKSSKGVLYKFS